MAVYDDQKQHTDEEGAMDREAHNGAAGDILDQERQAAKGNSTEKATAEPLSISKNKNDSGGLYHKEEESEVTGGKIKGIRGRFKKLGKKRARLLIAAGGGGVLLIGGIFLIALFLGSLIIPNFTSSVIGYQLARVTRETVATQAKQTAQKVAIDSASDSVYQQFKNSVKAKGQKFYDKTLGKLDKWRPAKQMKNLAASGELDFQYSEPKGIGSRVHVERVIVGGEGIDIPQNNYNTLAKLRYPVEYIQDKAGAKKALSAALKKAMPNSNFLVRARVAKAIRAKVGAKLFRWTEEDKKKMRGAKTTTADIENAKEARKIATGSAAEVAENAKTTKSLSDESKKAIQEAADAQNKCYANDACVKQIIDQGGGLSQEAVTAIENNVGEGVFKGVLKAVSPIYGVAVPVCMVYEGSTINSEDTINNNIAQQQRSFVGAAAAADQQKAGGKGLGEAIGAYSRQMGQVGKSIPQSRASGLPVNTSAELSAQASAGGTYEPNILTTIFGGIGDLMSGPMDTICPIATNPAVGAAMVALEAIPGINAGLEAAGQVTARTITAVVAKQFTNIIRTIFTKKTATKITAQTVATVGAAWIARLIVMQNIGASSDGSARGEAFDNQIDSGGNSYAQDLDRQQNFGGPLTNKQVSLLNPTDDQYRQEQFASQSFYQRYFAVTNPGSLMNRLAVTTASYTNLQSLSSFLASIPHLLNPANMLSKIASLSHPFSRVAAAASSDTDNQNYGNIQWAWTAAEEAAFEKNPEYQLFPNEDALGDKADDIASKYSHCFTDAIGTLLANEDLQRTEKGDIIPDAGDCAPDNYSPDSSSINPDGTANLHFKDNDAALAFRWRVSMRYQNSMDESLNIQEVTK